MAEDIDKINKVETMDQLCTIIRHTMKLNTYYEGCDIVNKIKNQELKNKLPNCRLCKTMKINIKEILKENKEIAEIYVKWKLDKL